MMWNHFWRYDHIVLAVQARDQEVQATVPDYYTGTRVYFHSVILVKKTLPHFIIHHSKYPL